MTNVIPSMRLKVNRDTFFIPDTDKGMYFRNNASSFRMEGETIVQWLDKLLPMLNGEYTLKELTDGLPGSYRNRVMEIAETLFANGFVRDVSKDLPSTLPDYILKKHGSQIEFLDHFGGSGAYRFQQYRQSNVLAVGSGPFFISLVSALLKTGLPAFQISLTEEVPTSRERIKEIVDEARTSDHEVKVSETVGCPPVEMIKSRHEKRQSFDAVLYVSQEGNIAELQAIHRVCRQEKIVFIPAIFLNGSGLAGPLVQPDSEGCWESAWRRLHRTALEEKGEQSAYSSTTGAMLANVITFELFKHITDVKRDLQGPKFYFLNAETLEGQWHSFAPHPAVTGRASACKVTDIDQRLEQGRRSVKEGKWFLYFSQLTSPQSGIFHCWEEGNLNQLPLSLCRIQAADPVSEGPAELLPASVAAGLTHEEARKEAGLMGVEAYVTAACHQPIRSLFMSMEDITGTDEHQFIGIGAGETFAECVCRGLQRCLDDEFRKQKAQDIIVPVELGEIEDERCRFYLQSLTTLRGESVIGLGKEVHGFPVVWVGVEGSWYGAVGLNATSALRNAVVEAIMEIQQSSGEKASNRAPFMQEKATVVQKLDIPTSKPESHLEMVQAARSVMAENGFQLMAVEVEIEPFTKAEPIEVIGVLLSKGELT
ncbi:putative thiazole-containing bacteriocin maturation protein [Bacillus testis]|uniref:putative thiazole-containing bacteriocin maturation protein n=1 Tax=Bacillus testis TaxID=1622072 RepID=UPI00067F0B45|nr:putative thiazole-containing bacteriocin maturation protein [Bacillus testis]